MVVISSGNILSQTFRVWFSNFLVFNLLGALAAAPLIVYCYSVLSGPLSFSALRRLDQVLIIGSLLISNPITGLVSYSTFKTLRGKPPSIGTAIGSGLTRILPILGTALLVALVVGVASGPLIWLQIEESTTSALLTLVMLVPMVVVTVMLSLAVPIAAVEGSNPIAAIVRSAKLTKGSKGTIFGALFAIGVLEMIAQKVTEIVFGSNIRSLDDAKMLIWILVGLRIVVMSLRGTAEAVAYHDIRTVREGVSTEDLASVFE